MKLKFKSLIFITIFFTTINVYSQDLRKESSFFYSKLCEYQEWLDSSGFKQVIKIDSLNITNKNVILFFGSQYEDMDTLAAAWCQLKKKYNSTNDKAIYKELFYRFVFDMEIGRDSAIINILGKTSYLFEIKIQFDKELVIGENFAPCQTMGRTEIKFKLNEIRFTSKDTTLKTSESLYAIRAKISDYLVNYYNKHNAYSKKPIIDILSDSRNELSFEVTQINNLILDRKFFEYHLFNIEVTKEDNEIVIAFDLKAKYGSGIINVPRKSDYKDMEPKFTPYVESFEKKVKNDIVNLLMH